MNIYIITCTFNDSQNVIDCAFKNQEDATAYAAALNGDKAKAAAHCRQIIALREGEEMVKFLDEKSSIAFEVRAVEIK